jgi:hypothetical protein
MTDIQIEIMYFSDCDNYRKACDVICDTVGQKDLNANIKLVSVNEVTDLNSKGFRGSPTVLINGKDVEECFKKVNNIDFDELNISSLACRLYICEDNPGCPSEEMIICALEQI